MKSMITVFILLLAPLISASFEGLSSQYHIISKSLHGGELEVASSTLLPRSPGNISSGSKEEKDNTQLIGLVRGPRTASQGVGAGVAQFGTGKAWTKAGDTKKYLDTRHNGRSKLALNVWDPVKASAGATDTDKFVQDPIFKQGFEAWASGQRTTASMYLRSGSKASIVTYQADGTKEKSQHEGPGQIRQTFGTRIPGRHVNTEIEVAGGGKAKVKGTNSEQ